jgi:hypothetical protein
VWKKEVIVEVMLSGEDNADWCAALPLLFPARWNHYIGFYYQLMQDFFSPFQPFPYQADTFWVQLAANGLPLAGTEILSHLFAFHGLPLGQPLQLICHFRSESPSQLDLKRFFKNSLKASTCIRYGKFGSSAITVDMTVNNIDDMFANFRDSNFEAYLGSVESEANNLGYRFIAENQEKIESLGVRVVGSDFMIERKVPRNGVLSAFWD